MGIPRIPECMSINEILARYPRTETLFQELRINRLQEGYESVDEIAWRHGVEVSQLIQQLRRAARVRQSRTSVQARRVLPAPRSAAGDSASW